MAFTLRMGFNSASCVVLGYREASIDTNSGSEN